MNIACKNQIMLPLYTICNLLTIVPSMNASSFCKHFITKTINMKVIAGTNSVKALFFNQTPVFFYCWLLIQRT